MSQVLAFAVSLVEINCGACGGTYAINERYRRQKEERGGFWNCPYCQCSWGFSQGSFILEKKALEKSLAEEKQLHNITLSRLNEAHKSIGKMKKRAAAGVCPCCNRTFTQLARHMKSKHPAYDA